MSSSRPRRFDLTSTFHLLRVRTQFAVNHQTRSHDLTILIAPFLSFCVIPRIGINWYNTTIFIPCCFTSVLATDTHTVTNSVRIAVSDNSRCLVWFCYLPLILVYQNIPVGNGVTSHKFFFSVWSFFWRTSPWRYGWILELTTTALDAASKVWSGGGPGLPNCPTSLLLRSRSALFVGGMLFLATGTVW